MTSPGKLDLIADASDLGEEPAGDLVASAYVERRRRLSWTRLLVALLLVTVAMTGLAWFLTERPDVAAAYPETDTWAAPYADVTNVPPVPFEDPGEAVSNVVLAFVVAGSEDPCSPAWGGVFGLDEAGNTLDLDRRLVRLRQLGKEPIVSFGGQLNQELAVSCADVDALTGAYLDVVGRYGITTVDFDLEGSDLADHQAHERRAAALAAVQGQRQDEGDELVVWFTLPVTANGLTADGVAAIDEALTAGVEVAGVNLMTMNFGLDGTTPMIDATTSALDGAAQQVLGAWRRAGLDITPGQAWSHLGVTPMIGRNDIVTEVFTLDDAQALLELARERGLARVSFWSLNRDQPCGPNYAPLASASDFCTHLDQDPGAFSHVLAPLTGDPAASAEAATTEVAILDDDPERSPYPIWQPEQAFLAGDKIVWHGYVYEAKWWTEGDDPEAPVVNVWETPWRILGPVLAEDLVEAVRVAPDAAPAWDGEQVYVEGDLVWLDGAVYEAKWWNEGFQPNRDVDDDADTPWRRLDSARFVDAD